MSTQEIIFQNGHLWYLLPLGLVVAILGFTWLYLWRRKMKEKTGDAHLVEQLFDTVSPARRIIRRVLWTGAFLLLIGAVLRPQYGMEDAQMRMKGIDLCIALDISYSMLAQDIQPDRLTGATIELSDLLDQLQGGRVALVPFAGLAYAQTPLTSDFEAIRIFLRDLDPTAVPIPGTAIGRALDVSLGVLRSDRRKTQDEDGVTEYKPFAGSKYKAILLITDGEDHGSKSLELAKEAKRLGIRIYTVGVGSTEGEVVPRINEDGTTTGERITDPDTGDVVMSKLNEGLLKEIAETTGGRYFHYTGTPIASEIYKEIEGLEKREYQAVLKELRIDRFQWLLLPALLLLFWEMFLSERRRRL